MGIDKASPRRPEFSRQHRGPLIQGLNNVGIPAVWGWGGGGSISMPRSADKAWTLIKIQNSDYPFGVDGEFTLTYTFPAGKSGEKKRAAPPAPRGEKEKEDRFDVNDVASKIADPAVRVSPHFSQAGC
jgi:hypothetical protein